MIHWYKFKNFYSYKDDTFVDMSLKKNSPETDYDFTYYGKKFSKVMAVMGANASGKSNLLRPLAFLSWFCGNSFKDQEKNDPLPLYPHKLAQNEPTELEICFSLPMFKEENVMFKYSVILNTKIVLMENLKIKLGSSHFKSAFKREYKNGKYNIKVNPAYDNEKAFPADEIKLVPSNISTISYLSRKDALWAKAIDKMFNTIFTNLFVHGKTSFNYRRVLQSAENYFNNPELFNIAINIIKQMDCGIIDIKLKEEEFIDSDSGDVTKKIIPYAIHDSDNGEFEMPFILESSGTQALFSFMLPLLFALSIGGLAVMDEIDSDLHPLMVLSILSLFENKETNKHNAQIIFSCHTPEILKRLKKHHVYLVEKENSVSESWRLDDIIGLRSQDNLYSKYMTGALGGVPDIDL